MPSCSCAAASPCSAWDCGRLAETGAGGLARSSSASQAVVPTSAATGTSSSKGLSGLNTQKRRRHWQQRSGRYKSRWRTLSWVCSDPLRILSLLHWGQVSGMACQRVRVARLAVEDCRGRKGTPADSAADDAINDMLTL